MATGREKATNFFNTAWSNRGTIGKVAVVGASAFAVYAVYKIGTRAYKSFQANKVAQTYKTDLNALQNAGIDPTYLDSQYLGFAGTLFQAMDSWLFDWGTDEEAVQGVMQQMRNDADVNKLVSAFGSKDGYTLPEWIAGDFSAAAKDTYVNNPLAANGIVYRF